MLAGLLLSFMVRRRRVFVRAEAAGPGGTLVSLGGLTRSDAAGGFEDEFAGLAAEIGTLHQGCREGEHGPPASGGPDPGPPAAGPSGPGPTDPHPTNPGLPDPHQPDGE